MAGELRDVAAVLLDIEGTITAISYVKDKLFGFVRRNLYSYLSGKYYEDEVQNDIKGILDEEKCDSVYLDVNSKEEVVTVVVDMIFSLMDRDKKSVSLKQLQGHMYKKAFESKAIIGESVLVIILKELNMICVHRTFPDVLPCLKQMKESGLVIAIYSSGNVFAQKLIFGNTQDGDVTELFSGFFDATIGSKFESSSYTKISKQLGFVPERILFLTDVAKEGLAAKQAGCQVRLVVREGNAPLTDQDKKDFQLITSFQEIMTIAKDGV